ncbi:MAG: hypothetical protein ACRD9R_17145 [Pyrinomonadaceae bacterium]
MKKLCIACLLLVTLLAGVASYAQTLSYFREKYGQPDSKGLFAVRPNIVMAVQVDKKGQVCKALIKSINETSLSASKPRTVPSKLMTDIINEVVPVAQRGRRGRTISLSGGCTSVQIEDYANVSIKRTLICKSENEKEELSVEVNWKDRGCQ